MGHKLIGITFGLILGALSVPWVVRRWEQRENDNTGPEAGKNFVEKMKLYLDGKIKRFWLLFGVNGGAFAIMQLLTDNTKKLPGELSPKIVAIGAILFTVLMISDIWSWGWFMRRKTLLGDYAFTIAGQVIVLFIGGLIVAAWVLVGF